MIIVLMKKKVVKTRSVRVYIAYINDFDIWMLLLIPTDDIIDLSGYYSLWTDVIYPPLSEHKLLSLRTYFQQHSS